MLSGSAFQAIGPATEKVRRPNCVQRWRETNIQRVVNSCAASEIQRISYSRHTLRGSLALKNRRLVSRHKSPTDYRNTHKSRHSPKTQGGSGWTQPAKSFKTQHFPRWPTNGMSEWSASVLLIAPARVTSGY